MAAFTALALGLGLLGGKLASDAAKRRAAAPATPPPTTAPAPTQGSLAAPAPPDAGLAASNAAAAGIQAAKKQRRKATNAELSGITGQGGTSSVPKPAPILQPRSLSGY